MTIEKSYSTSYQHYDIPKGKVVVRDQGGSADSYSKGACEGTEPVTLVGTPERRRPPRNFKTGK
jgi:hypothetical protein